MLRGSTGEKRGRKRTKEEKKGRKRTRERQRKKKKQGVWRKMKMITKQTGRRKCAEHTHTYPKRRRVRRDACYYYDFFFFFLLF